MKNTDNHPISLNDLKTFVPLLLVLASVVYFGSTLKGQVEITDQKVDSVSKQQDGISKRVDDLAKSQQSMAEELVRLNTIIETNKNLGNLSKASQAKTYAIAYPTPEITPTQPPSFSQGSNPDVTFNTYTNSGGSAQTQPTPTPTNAPNTTVTPIPQPINPTPSIVDTVLTVVTGLFK